MYKSYKLKLNSNPSTLHKQKIDIECQHAKLFTSSHPQRMEIVEGSRGLERAVLEKRVFGGYSSKGLQNSGGFRSTGQERAVLERELWGYGSRWL